MFLEASVSGPVSTLEIGENLGFLCSVRTRSGDFKRRIRSGGIWDQCYQLKKIADKKWRKIFPILSQITNNAIIVNFTQQF
jgi:hypothetical protein